MHSMLLSMLQGSLPYGHIEKQEMEMKMETELETELDVPAHWRLITDWTT